LNCNENKKGKKEEYLSHKPVILIKGLVLKMRDALWNEWHKTLRTTDYKSWGHRCKTE